jgi:transcriptional regulator with XRE-family HTH domain
MGNAVESAIAMTFAKRLKAARRKAGLTQQKLAQRIGMSLSAVAKAERGAGDVGLSTAVKMAAAVGVGIGELAGKVEGRPFW